MRRLTILMAMLTLASLVSMSQAGLFGWRTYWRRVQRPFYTNTQIDSIQYAEENGSTSLTGDRAPATAVHTLSSPGHSPHAPTQRLRTLDEQRVAELGPDWARMVYPRDSESDPYPACKAWKWDSDDGWDWDWSDLNCPWRQMGHQPDFYSD